MDRATLLERLRGLLAEVLELPSLPPDASMDATPEWDSLRQLQVIYAVERVFGVEIAPEDAIGMTSLPAIADRVLALGARR
jgi:acyl carrier protein